MQRADQAEGARRRAVAAGGGRGLQRGAAEREDAEDEHDQEVGAELHAVLGAHSGALRSRIGRWTVAAASASALESPHIRSYAPVASWTTPPSQTPRNAPIWCERKTKPNSIPTWRVPNMT